MPTYRIQPGGSFKLPDGSLKTAGELIDLDADVADMHTARLQPVQADTTTAADPINPADQAHPQE